MYAGPKIVRDGLVFGYDTGANPSSNFDHKSDQRRFFKGRLTENLFGTTAMSFQDDAGIYTNDIVSGTDSIGDYFIKDTVNAPWWAGLRIYQNGVSPLTAGISYVLSFECRSEQTGWSWSYDSNASGGGWSGNDVGRLSNTNLVFDKTGGTTYTSDMANTWQRVSYRVTMKDSNTFTGASAYPHDSFFTNTNNVKIYYRNPQLELGKTVATPYVAGTRSSTESLIGLTKSTTIDVSNVSFDSDGLPTFDGTNDYVDLGADIEISPINQGWTAEYVFNTNNASTLQHFNGCDEDVHNAGWIALYNSKLAVWNRSPGTWKYGDTVFSSNTWYHVVFVQTSGTTMQFYVNGEPEGGDHTTYTWNADKSAFFCRYVGKYKYLGNSSRYFNGEIPITKLYNRALSAQEVQQNFKAYKNRFNL